MNRQPVCRHGVLPPHILTNIALNGSRRQREAALTSLSADHSIRTARVGSQPIRPPGARPLGLAALAPVKQVTVYDAEHGTRLPGRRVRGEQDPPTGDVAVDEAWQYISDTWDFYLDAYERDSIDGNGMALDGSVHYSVDYDNAFWDGRRMVFGDGDQEIFDRFTKCVDVIGHELTHGVTDDEAGLIYWAQSGALNESVSDVFGSLVKQYVNDQKADQADWLIGEGLFMPDIQGVALRSMSAPGTAYDDPVLGKDPQPADMDHYVRGIDDNGGVHINSGIPNHAVYLAATNIGGFAWEGAGLIWYATLTSPWIRRTTQFRGFAMVTVHQAEVLFPGTDAGDAVREAWAEVGIPV
jgi:Zn-dependent metalloprotease